MADKKRFATLGSSKKDERGEKDSSSDEDEGRQGFYVGGGEHSGQQVLGGRDETGDLISQVIRAAQMHGARPVSPDEEAQSSDRSSRPTGATGYRLGDFVRSSEPMRHTGSGSFEPDDDIEPDVEEVVLSMWRNGFTVDDGPLRPYDDPENTAFLNSIMRNQTPMELVRQHRGKEIDLKIERKDLDYIPPKAKPFSGQGQRLGEIVPKVAGGGTIGVKYGQGEPQSSGNSSGRILQDAVKQAQESVNLKEGEPVTQLQLRFPDGQRIIGRFNHSHLVEEVRSFVVSAVPDLAFQPFNLMTTFPNRVIEEEDKTLADAGLLNSVILIKYV